MHCLRCGRETENEQVFCFLCESVMVKHPIKPHTVVTIPDRAAATQAAPVRKPAWQEVDPAPLRRTIGHLRLWVGMLLAMLMLCAALLTWQELRRTDGPAIGQNYSSITEQTNGHR